MTLLLRHPPAAARIAGLQLTAARFARLASIVCATALLASAFSFAQSQAPQQKTTHHRRPAAKPAAAHPLQPALPPAPVAPPQPKWPANAPPAAPDVTFNSQGLRIVADNSSLSSILKQVSTETGAKVEGLSSDERVFGDYGPGQPREIIGQLLSGVNYNVLILGDEAQGEPLHVLLSPRPNGPAPPVQPQAPDREDEFQPEPEVQPIEPPIIRPPMNQEPPRRPMTPQERMQEMQQRQRELMQPQQQQQEQQPQ